MKICSVADCPTASIAGGMCSKHYARWKKNGKTELTERAACIVEGCDTVRSSGGVMCALHRNRHLHSGDPNQPEPPCAVDQCPKEAYARGWCVTHYGRWSRHGDPLLQSSPLPPRRRRTSRPDVCIIDGCENEHSALDLCVKHYQRWRAHGDPNMILYAPYGSGHIDENGYRRISVNGKTTLEHRHAVAESLGRPLMRSEVVHHINGDRLDNRPENLELWNTGQPRGQRVPDKVAWAIELLDLYAPKVLSREPYQLQI